MRLLKTFACAYPGQSALVLCALLLAGIAEGFGVSALLPLLALAGRAKSESVSHAPHEGETGDSGLMTLVTEMLAGLGLSPTIGVLLSMFICGIVLKCALMLAANRQVGYTVAHVATDLRLSLLRALLVTRWEYYISKPVGGFANAVATEAMRASQAYLCAARMTAFLAQAVVYACVAVLVSWKATLISMTVGCLLLYLLNRLIKMARRAGVRQTDLLQSLLTRLTDILQSIKPLKAMAREERADAVLVAETNRLNSALRKQVFSKEALRSLQEPMLMVFLACGIYAALRYWSMPLASVLVLVFLLARLLRQLGKVQEQYQKMAVFESAYWSLQSRIEDVHKEEEPPLGTATPSLVRGIRFENVDFGYRESKVLRDVTAEFPAGSFTALVGPSGAGKTTVGDLIMALLRPTRGRIWVDDVPLDEVELKSWRRMIGYVPQETLLLHDSVLMNVTLGDEALDEDDAVKALRAAGAWQFVEDLPKGIHSLVGERGGKLSGGQRQRVAIARALVHEPALLILDEATSGLDPATEADICETLRGLGGSHTIIAISHQPALVRSADRAYSLENGSVVQLGEPERQHS